jgi:modulator of FtsH protease HflK
LLKSQQSAPTSPTSSFSSPQSPTMSQNKNDGPPDLDEIVRKFNQKLAALFGGGNSGPRPVGTGGTPSPIRPNAIGGGIALILGVAAVVWMATGFYIVEEGKRGVELRLGKYSTTTMPGPRWHWPYPFETHEIVNISAVRTVEVGYRNKQKMPQEALMLTKDKNIVDVQFAVQYDVKDPEDFLFSNRFSDQEGFEFVRQVGETAIREIVGKSDMDFVLNEGRGDIPTRVQRLMQTILDRYKSGITVRTVTMQNAQPPEQVQAAFDDFVRAAQDGEKFKNEGEAYRNARIPEARGLAARLLEEANAHRSRVTANAEGDAARFRQVLTEYEKAPAVTRERLYLETMQQIMANSTKVMVDQKAGNNILSLPLDRILQSGGTVTTSDVVPPRVPETSTSATAGTEAARPAARESFRTRESR